MLMIHGRRDERQALPFLTGNQRIHTRRMAHLRRCKIQTCCMIQIGARAHDNGIEPKLGHDFIGLLKVHAGAKNRWWHAGTE